jgi:penicillin amidase
MASARSLSMKPTLSFALLAGLLLTLLVPPVPAAESTDRLLRKANAVLAQLEGEITLPGLKEPVEVLRDRWGVPHIYARNQDDLFFAQGFIAAQDRLFQIDLWRRVGVGETAEVIGREGIEIDRFARLLKYRGDLEAEWASYGPDARRIATAFTNGINAAIDHMGERLPVEFRLLGVKPKKWIPEDCLGRMSGIIMTRSFQSEVARAELIAAVGVQKARSLAPTDPVREYAPDPGLSLEGIDRTILAGYTAATRQPLFRAGDDDGSNNWVVDGTLSASGKPLLASDPHRNIALPSLRYLVHLNAPGWNVIGAGEPGIPGVALGHNDKVAWGFTIVGSDQTDLFVEETKPDDPTQYRAGDRWEKMTVVREKVTVKGNPKPTDVELHFTRHGPVLHEDAERHRAYALKWVGSEPGTAAYLAGLAVDRSNSGREFVESLRSWKMPGENMVYADVDGTIGWVAAGLTPIRKRGDGLLPVPGWGGDYEWTGFLTVKDLPQSVNPAGHSLVTANNNLLPAGYPHEIGYEFAPPYRHDRIEQRLEAQKQFRLEDFMAIQHDTTSLPGLALARLARTIKPDHASLKPYVELMANWDGVLSKDSKAGPLYAVWVQELLEDFFRPHVPAKHLSFVATRGALPRVLAELENPDKLWFGDNPVAARDQLLLKSLAAAGQKVKVLLPGETDRLSWGRLHVTAFHHPLATLGPAYAKAFNLGPVPRGGDAVTPNAAPYNPQFEQTSGASYRELFDLGDWDRGLATSVPGQSGQPGSPHYADLLPLWDEGKYFPLAFSRGKVEEVTQHRLLLKPMPE